MNRGNGPITRIHTNAPSIEGLAIMPMKLGLWDFIGAVGKASTLLPAATGST